MGRRTTHSDTCACSDASITFVSRPEDETALYPLFRVRTNFFRRGGRNVLEAMWTILYASDDVRSFAARSLVVARALPRGRARWAHVVDAPDPVLWGPATLPETTPRKLAPSREGGLWRLAGGRRAARPDWRRGAPRVGWTRSCTPKRGRQEACTGSNS